MLRRFAQRRGIHSVYGGFKNQGSGALPSMLGWGSCRGSVNTHFKELPEFKGYTAGGRRLASSLQHDTERLLASDWTTDYSSFWVDQLEAHKLAYTNLYEGGVNPIAGFFTALSSFKPEEAAAIQRQINYFSSVVKWAEEAQDIYSEIFDQRFHMQRGVWDAIEREKILAGCTEMVVDYGNRVPAEFKRKATKDIEWHLWNLRHWVWDAPNTKAAFPRVMA
eukprot:TRINITY_DN42868_c0_g1_i1.p1 TRINITY_DN42868_c0_g1~~TRINITY_DN42868_c0_g1_i1.p1  ORF type:complete len:221 (+),score=57.24 TRINITY_DN42868_c0_g1_i1:68-730(+)